MPEWKIYRGMAQCEVYLHLFSGRRRQHDFAYWIDAMAQKNGRHCMAVSLDIVYGADLTCQKQLKWWIDQIRKGAIANILKQKRMGDRNPLETVSTPGVSQTSQTDCCSKATQRTC